MAHFAQLDANNIVVNVIVVNNDVCDNLPFPESEPLGVAFCQNLLGANTIWAQTSYNSSFRYNYAGIDFTFDATAGTDGAFIAPCPGPGWVLDTTTYQWVEVTPQPVGGDNTPPVTL